jgi:hypothetical protein
VQLVPTVAFFFINKKVAQRTLLYKSPKLKIEKNEKWGFFTPLHFLALKKKPQMHFNIPQKN